jgi:hypothetical protein
MSRHLAAKPLGVDPDEAAKLEVCDLKDLSSLYAHGALLIFHIWKAARGDVSSEGDAAGAGEPREAGPPRSTPPGGAEGDVKLGKQEPSARPGERET